jgi:hypothetical protein
VGEDIRIGGPTKDDLVENVIVDEIAVHERSSQARRRGDYCGSSG